MRRFALISATYLAISLALLLIVSLFEPLQWGLDFGPSRYLSLRLQRGTLWIYSAKYAGDATRAKHSIAGAGSTKPAIWSPDTDGGSTKMSAIANSDNPSTAYVVWTYSYAYRGWACPLYLPLLLLAACPLIAYARAIWRRRRHRPGHCRRCDYDLTGNTSGVCPECGAPAASESLDA